MRKTITSVSFILLSLILNAQVLDQSHTGSNNWYTCTTDGQITGQSFTAGQSGILTGIEIDLNVNSCTQTSTYTFVIDIIDGEGFGGSVLATDTIVLPLPHARSMTPITFSQLPSVTSGNVYTIRMSSLPGQVCDSMMGMPMIICAQWLESDNDTYDAGIPYLNGAPDNVYDKYFNTFMIACGADIADQSHTGSNNWYTCTTDGQIVGQSFMAATNGFLNGIDIDLQINSCTDLNQYQFVADLLSGDGYGGTVLASDTVTVPLPFPRTMLPVIFTDTVSMEAGLMYTLRLTPISDQLCDSMMGINVCAQWMESDNDTYGGGTPYLNGAPDNVYDKYFITRVNTNAYSTISETVCGNYISPSGNYTWDSTGIYFDTIPSMSGCDSIISIDLQVAEVDTSVTQASYTLTANATGASYQWIDCNTNLPFAGDTNQTFVATFNGDYAVIVTENGCSDTSACILVLSVGLSRADIESGMVLYPNPAKNKLTVEIRNFDDVENFVITDLAGRIVMNGKIQSAANEINITDLLPGHYLITIGEKMRSTFNVIK